MTDLQIAYMYTLMSKARIRKSLAQSFALLNDVEEMTTYLLYHAPEQCQCTNNSDLCGRCEILETIRRAS
jgi:hypothetical protein